MKNLLGNLLWLAALLLAACAGQEKSYVISHSSPQYVDGQYMYLMDDITRLPLDSARIAGSAFRIESRNMGSGVGWLRMGTSSAQASATFIPVPVFLEEGDIAIVPDSICHLAARGTSMNDAYNNFVHFSLKNADDEDKAKEKLLQLVQRHDALSCYLLQNLLYSLPKAEVENLMAGFPEEMKRHPLFLHLKKRIDAIRADVGLPYFDFAAPDTLGRTVALADIVKQPGCRYVLLEFWATWCGPCVREIPHLKAVYRQYKDKGFDIYGCSADSNREHWKQFISSQGMAWTNVLPRTDHQTWNDLPEFTAYGLQAVPLNFLIDASTGQIIAKNLQGEKLKEKLAGLLD